MKRTIPFLLVYITVPALILGILWGGLWNLATPGVAFLMIPFADAITSHDMWNPDDDDEKGRWWDFLYQMPLYLWVPVQLGILGWGLVEATTRSGWDFVGLAVSMGLFTGGIGITIAHELMHRTAKHEKAMAEILMYSVSYVHFCIEHVFGHHKHVGTPRDAASSRLGEGLYAFLPRVIFQSLFSAIDLEKKRCKRRSIGWFSLRNRTTRYALVQSGIWAGVAVGLGPKAFAFFALQSVVAIILLEIINYIEHYGLQRKEIKPGKYERVQPEHSWNASHRFSNYWLFNLQRHADHHAYANRPYHLLRTTDEGPQLPYGYPTMLLISLVPPLWKHIMDPRVAEVVGSASPR